MKIITIPREIKRIKKLKYFIITLYKNIIVYKNLVIQKFIKILLILNLCTCYNVRF